MPEAEPDGGGRGPDRRGERLGPWRVLARVGQGGMGTVWLAEDDAGRRAAVKVLDREADARGLKRFGQELELLRRLEHPRLVRALGGLESTGGAWWFAMDYVRGRSLAQLLEEVGRLDVGPALDLAADALEGLAAAHAAGVLHRDVKSANILVDDAGRASLCDFGLARAADQTRVTVAGTILGTPAYASPEQGRGQESRAESDVYGVGVVLYEALTGTLPFRAETPLALLRQHLDDPPDPPSSRRPDLPPSVDALVLRALRKRAEERFPGAQAMRAAVLALRDELARPSPKPRPGRWALGLVVGGLVGGALAGGALLARRPVDAPAAAPSAPSSAAVVSSGSGRPVLVELTGGEARRGELLGIAGDVLRLRGADGATEALPLGGVRLVRYEADR